METPTTSKGCESGVTTGQRVGHRKDLGLAVILEICPKWAVRGQSQPQSLAGTGKKGLGKPAPIVKAWCGPRPRGLAWGNQPPLWRPGVVKAKRESLTSIPEQSEAQTRG